MDRTLSSGAVEENLKLIVKKINISTYWKDVLYQASGNTVAQIIGILGIPLLTRLYTPETFAIQAIFVQIVIFLAAFVSFRFEYFLPLLKNSSEARSLGKWILITGFIMTVIFTLILWLLDTANVLDGFGVSIPTLFYLAPATAYIVCLSVLVQHESQRQGNFTAAAVGEVSAKVGYISSGAILALFTHVSGLVLTTMLGAAAKIISLRTYGRQLITGIQITQTGGGLINKYKARAGGMVVSNSILAASGLLPILFIGKQYDANTLGQFSLVMATVFLPSGVIGAAVGSVFFQRTAILWNSGDYAGLKAVWKETLVKLLAMSVPVYTGVYLLSPWAYPFFFGDQWNRAGEIASLMSIAALFSFLAGPLDKMSLVLGVAYYLPLIHSIRLIVIVSIAFATVTFSYGEQEFILMYALGMSFVYILDIGMCRALFTAKVKSHDSF